MKKPNKNNGFAIALAWPQTYCKQPGAWYDKITNFLGVSDNYYYKVGHAAIVLIDKINARCHYFDFGRYHAPFQHGRVRSAETDHDLVISSIPILSEDENLILNLKEILKELQDNSACHGDGELHASYCPINFKKAYDKARQIQNNSPHPYGPFDRKGSNCSRFVNTIILSGKPDIIFTMKLRYLIPFTPTPMNNVSSLMHKHIIPSKNSKEISTPKIEKSNLRRTLLPPKKHPNIPSDAQWLSGEGAGSWFFIERIKSALRVVRYSPNGKVECEGFYISSGITLPDAHSKYKITFPSHCSTITLLANNKLLQFTKV